MSLSEVLNHWLLQPLSFSIFGVIEGLNNCGLGLYCSVSHSLSAQQWCFSLQRHRVATKTPK